MVCSKFPQMMSVLVSLRQRLFVLVSVSKNGRVGSLDEVMLSWYHDEEKIESVTEFTIYPKATAIISANRGNTRVLLKQNHLVDPYIVHPSRRNSKWLYFILDQDQITKRIIRIQRWMKKQFFKKRLQLLLIIAANKNINTDVIQLISLYL